MRKEYEILDHSSDIKFRVYGKSKRDLFVNITKVVTDFLNDFNDIDIQARKKYKTIQLKKDTIEKEIFDYVTDLIYLNNVEGSIFELVEFTLDKNEEFYIVKLILMDVKETNEIKAMTYHEFKLDNYDENISDDERIDPIILEFVVDI